MLKNGGILWGFVRPMYALGLNKNLEPLLLGWTSRVLSNKRHDSLVSAVSIFQFICQWMRRVSVSTLFIILGGVLIKTEEPVTPAARMEERRNLQ